MGGNTKPMKNYLIVGASTGIGKALALQLKTKHNVWGTYLKNEIQDPEINSFCLDVLSPEMETFPLPEVLDGFVYCPGSIVLKPFARFTTRDFIQDYELQFLGMVRTLQAVLPALKKSENASIVLFSTVAVQSGFPFHTLVSASKGAIEGFAKALAAELAPKIRVNVIAPSLTHTPLASSLLQTQEKIESNAARHPLRRIGSPEDIASMAEFLLGENASWITGQVMKVDGGISTLKV